MRLRTFSDYRPSVFSREKTRLERLLCEIMEESLSEEPWPPLLARLVRFTSVFLIVLITGLTKLLLRPFDPSQRTNCISSLLALSEKGVISKVKV